jgi:hypothetical protein
MNSNDLSIYIVFIGDFSSGALAFQLGGKKYQLGEDFFIYHISFGRIILIHLVPLPLARQMSVHHGEVEVGFGTGYLVHENVIGIDETSRILL